MLLQKELQLLGEHASSRSNATVRCSDITELLRLSLSFIFSSLDVFLTLNSPLENMKKEEEKQESQEEKFEAQRQRKG